MSRNPFRIARRYERHAVELAMAEPVRISEIRRLRHAAEAEILVTRRASALARLVPPRWALAKLNILIFLIRRREIRQKKLRKAERVINRLERRLERLERDAGLNQGLSAHRSGHIPRAVP